jgi:hypothetical protein
MGSITDTEKLKTYSIIPEIKAIPLFDRRIVEVRESP